MNNTDLRIQKTRLAIENALIELLQVQEFDEISIVDICEKALINRKTFYAHYSGKSALVGVMLGELKQQMQTIAQQRDKRNQADFAQINADFFSQHNKRLLALWKVRTKRYHLWQDMLAMCESVFTKLALAKHPDSRASDWNYLGKMYAVLLMNSMKYHLEQGQAVRQGHFLEQMERMLTIAKFEGQS